MISPQMENYYEKLRSAKRQEYALANRQTLVDPELIFIGDSIMEWFPIEQGLAPKKNWVNRGIAAYNSQHLREHLPIHIFGQSLSDLVLLIGTNDIGYEFPLEKTIDNIRTIIEEISKEYPLVTIHLLEVLPVNEAPIYQQTVDNRTNQLIKELNQAYQTLAMAYPQVHLVKTFHDFLDSDGQLAAHLTKDGLHLSEAGYEKLANLVAPII